MFSIPEHSVPPVGVAVRAARVQAGLSLRALAGQIGVSAATLSAIENGRTGLSVQRLQRVAAVLEVAPARLLSMTGADTAATSHREESAQWRSFPPLTIDPVLRGAIDAFVETGYHGTSMRMLAARIGVSVPGIYHHYADKQQLLVRILDVTMSELSWRIESARREADDGRSEVALIVEALALFHTHHRKLAFIGASEMRSLEGPNRRRITGLRDRVQYMLDEAVDRGIADGTLQTSEPRAAARAIATMCTSLPQWFRDDGPRRAEDIARAYVGFAVAMLTAPATDKEHKKL
ncbi:TetR family transcriptional regulator [Mycolicibacterium fluoranthenivorans]|uniref:TetR family transcriptional regulator n=1 Tax=Mycolicibacterium fluoranthenivorans TaxID=258505 RepID=A0A7G8PGB8_9MYCO|nr:helix-turn-helix domain-containing protein [Mycolicibacterium fluoranthenivorans]QNJ93384.1 TetR family transcriptional regulator [Mycolicibacterium fluoranthenivorans]